MYNQLRKQAFMLDRYKDGSERTKLRGYNIFNLTQGYENDLDKDVCEFTIDELQTVVNDCFGTRFKSVQSALSFLKSYNAWCLDHGYKATDSCYKVVFDSKEKVNQTMVSSPKHLLVELNKYFDQPEMKTIDCIYRSYFWLSFSGITIDEIPLVRNDEVNLDDLIIEHSGDIYELDKESIHDIRNAKELTEFLQYHPGYTKPSVRKRKENCFLLRGIKTDVVSYPTFVVVLKRKVTDKRNPLSLKRVYYSGIYYDMFMNEMSGFKPDFTAIATKQIIKDEEYNGKLSRLRDVECQLRKDYALWKEAFL